MNLREYRSQTKRVTLLLWTQKLAALRSAVGNAEADPSLIRRMPVNIWAEMALICGSHSLHDVFHVSRDVCRLSQICRDVSMGDVDLCGFVNLMACCGSVDCTALLVPRLRGLKSRPRGTDVERRWHFARAFAGVAMGLREIYRDPAAAEVALDELMPFTPGILYDNNPQALLAHLAAGVENCVAVDDVWPAFRECVHNFPYHEEVGDFDGACLFWIARIVYHRIGGQPLGQVADWLSRHFNAWADGHELPPLGAP